VLSKRKLIQLVEEKHVDGWDDPRLPTLVGARRRGYTAEGFRRFAERIGVAKSDSWIDYGVLEECMRDDLNETHLRRIAVLDPLKLVIDNYPEGQEELCEAPNHPQQPELGKRAVPFSRELWIEREDFMEDAAEGLFPPVPRQQGAPALRLRHEVHGLRQGCRRQRHRRALRVPRRQKSGTPGADAYKVKGNIHWVSAKHAYHRSAALRPAVQAPSPIPARAAATSSKTSIPIRSAASSRATGAGVARMPQPEGPLPVRAPRLLRRRPRRLAPRARRCSTAP
jgi:glutaminyl-tRNA synthetase